MKHQKYYTPALEIRQMTLNQPVSGNCLNSVSMVRIIDGISSMASHHIEHEEESKYNKVPT